MTWNYRIVRRSRDGHAWFALHEVYYHPDGRPQAITVDPAQFVADVEEGHEGIIRALQLALADARSRPVLDEAQDLPGTDVGSRADTAADAPLAALDKLMDAEPGTVKAEHLGALATAIQDRETLQMKQAQLYQAIGHLIAGGATSDTEQRRLLDYAVDETFDPDFLPWPRTA
jgi:hypothetical protein